VCDSNLQTGHPSLFTAYCAAPDLNRKLSEV
jgi:hypothetical protein